MNKYVNIKKFIVDLISWFKHYLIVNSKHCDIRCKIPLSTRLPHYGLCVVIPKNVKIGENCYIRPGCKFGQRKGKYNIIIGDNVVFGVNVVVIGNVTIGDNAKIGANAVILKNVPKNKTVYGIWKQD